MAILKALHCRDQRFVIGLVVGWENRIFGKISDAFEKLRQLRYTVIWAARKGHAGWRRKRLQRSLIFEIDIVQQSFASAFVPGDWWFNFYDLGRHIGGRSKQQSNKLRQINFLPSNIETEFEVLRIDAPDADVRDIAHHADRQRRVKSNCLVARSIGIEPGE